MNNLEQIEEVLKKGYKRAVLCFSKSSQNKTTSYFIEIIKSTANKYSYDNDSERIYVSRKEYIMSQELIDKYDAIQKSNRDKEKERKAKVRLDRENREDKEQDKFVNKTTRDPNSALNDEYEEDFIDYTKDVIDKVFEAMPLLGEEEIDNEEDELDEDDKLDKLDKLDKFNEDELDKIDKINKPDEEIDYDKINDVRFNKLLDEVSSKEIPEAKEISAIQEVQSVINPENPNVTK